MFEKNVYDTVTMVFCLHRCINLVLMNISVIPSITVVASTVMVCVVRCDASYMMDGVYSLN